MKELDYTLNASSPMLLIRVLNVRDRNEIRVQVFWLWITSSLHCQTQGDNLLVILSWAMPKAPDRLWRFVITLPYGSLKSHDHKAISDSADLETMSYELRWIFRFTFFPCGLSVVKLSFLRWHFLNIPSFNILYTSSGWKHPVTPFTLILTYYQCVRTEAICWIISGTRDHSAESRSRN